MTKRPLIAAVAAGFVVALLFTIFTLLWFVDVRFHHPVPRPIGGIELTFGTFFYGLIGVTVAAFVAVFLFTAVNDFLKR